MIVTTLTWQAEVEYIRMHMGMVEISELLSAHGYDREMFGD